MDRTTKIFRCIFVCILVFAIFFIFVILERPVQPKHLNTNYDNNSKIYTIKNLSSNQTNFYSNLVCKVYLGEWHYKEIEFDINPYETIELDLNDYFIKEKLQTKTISIKIASNTTFIGGTIVLIISIAIILLLLALLLKIF